MKSFSEFLNEKDVAQGYFPEDFEAKLQTNISGLMLEYLRYVSDVDGRTIKWHINKSIEMYIQQLGKE